MNWVSLIFILFVVYSLMSYLSKRRKLKSGYYWRESALGVKISYYKNNFSSIKSAGIKVKDSDYQEFFQIFPFCSDFKNTESKLGFDVLTMREINEIQNKIRKQFAIFENAINKIFNSSLNFINLGADEVYDLYVSYLNEVYLLYTSLFTDKILIYYKQNKSLELKKIELYKKVNDAIEAFYLETNSVFNLYWNLKFAEVRNSIIKANSSKFHSYSESSNGPFNSFFGNSSSKSNNNFFNNQINNDLSKEYKILNVSPNCTDDELKKAYRKMSKKYHPDINKSDSAPEKMAEINAAYDAIKKVRKLD